MKRYSVAQHDLPQWVDAVSEKEISSGKILPPERELMHEFAAGRRSVVWDRP